MKNILLLFFTSISISIFAQSNELVVSYQSLKKDDYGKGLALNFYKQTSNKTALGIKLNANANTAKQIDYFTKHRSFSVDVVSRRTIFQKHNFRLMGEFGISVLRNYIELFDTDEYFEEMSRNNPGGWFCGVISHPREAKLKENYPDEDWFKSNHYGLTSALSLDYTINKIFTIGTSYNFSFYKTSNEDIIDKKTRRSNLNLNLGINF